MQHNRALMYEPLTSSTLVEAAEWLTEATGQNWSQKRLLDGILSRTPSARGDWYRSCIFVLPPKFTAFAYYDHAPDGRTAFRRLQLNCKFPLPIECAIDIFDHGEGKVSTVTHYEETGRYSICIEPISARLCVTLAMLRIGRNELMAFFEGLSSATQLPQLPPLSLESLAGQSAAGDYETTWWSLRVLATENEWSQAEARPIIAACLASLADWDSLLLSKLLSGPTTGHRERLASTRGRVHTLGQRERVLDVEIRTAAGLAADPSSAQSIFSELVKLAQATPPYGCLLEAVGPDIKYLKGDTVMLFSVKNLRDRMHRDKTR